MNQRPRVFALIVTAVLNDDDYTDLQDLSEIATVFDGALSRGVRGLNDLTVFELTEDDMPNGPVWAEVQEDARQQLRQLAGIPVAEGEAS
ncbi:MAG: hypothetical protein M1272_05575 [Firmicutes bacterium]|nr:hypothetical protein [Bacillota bacterium]